MGCRLIRLKSGRLALRMQWILDRRSIRVQERLPAQLATNARTLETIERTMVGPIDAEMRAGRFTRERYLEWFPRGAKALQFLKDLGRHPAPAPTTPALVDWYLAWLGRLQPPAVRASYRRDVKQAMTAYVLPMLGDRELSTINRKAVLDLRDQLLKRGLAVRTTRNILGILRACWWDAYEGGLVHHDPFVRIKLPRVPSRRPDPFTLEERDMIIALFRDGFRRHYSAFVLTLFLTGLRFSEAVALTVGDVDLVRGKLQVLRSRHLKHEAAPKTAHSERTIDLAPEVVQALRPLIEGRPRAAHLFETRAGNPLESQNWRKHWQKGLELIGVRYRKPYSTRHTFISLAISGGAPPGGVADYAGTSQAMIEKHYARYMPRNRGIVTFIDPVGDGAKTQPSEARVAFGTKNPSKIGMVPTGVEPVLPT